MSRVKITALSPQTIARIDLQLKTLKWRDDTYQTVVDQGIFDVEISDDCTVSYMTTKGDTSPIYPIVLLMNGRHSGIERNEYHQIIGE